MRALLTAQNDAAPESRAPERREKTAEVYVWIGHLQCAFYAFCKALLVACVPHNWSAGHVPDPQPARARAGARR
jgi:hypothetical protein